MLAYVIIAIELAILYTVFWYVFLREPKPYRLRGNAWGAYDGAEQESQGFSLFNKGRLSEHGDDCGCQAEKDAKIRTASAIYEEWNAAPNGSGKVPLTAGELIRSQARGVERVTREIPFEKASAPQYAPFNPAEQCRSGSTIDSKNVSAFLAKLGDKLNRINVKLP
ncbi:MAG: hypothetical protein JSS83_10640 [Cyanobacteria bacterium SZAS LIN-3]|nr:hypothetical protein [Cyanobacteria bacterium SZAS LIN-3]